MHLIYSNARDGGVSRLKSVEKYPGETIETKVRRIQETDESIKDGAPIIYTEKKDGVLPAYDVRTDRFEIATEAMDKVHRDAQARSEGGGKVIPLNKDEKSGENTTGEVGEPKS